MNGYPRIHLAVDNCFAVKRWVEPRDWMEKVYEIGGITQIQASTDNEIDPTHNTKAFRSEWVDEVKKCGRQYGFKVASFYSGYAEYRTAGIASLHESKRKALISRYFEPVVDIAAELNAQVGNTLGAYSEPVLQDPVLFARVDSYVENSLVKMARYAGRKGVLFGYEQMYTPTQGMWTIDGCIRRMKDVYAKAGFPMYITIDTAHQAGQHLFLRPSQSDIADMQETGDMSRFRLPDAVIRSIRAKEDPQRIAAMLDSYAYWFAGPKDADVYEWLAAAGCYSPIVHLQQTDGTYSAHRPFTQKYNESGIIHPQKVLKAIRTSYEAAASEGMPPKVTYILLAFEIFFGVCDSAETIIESMRESVQYWREYLPRDGMTLDQIV